MGVVELGDAGEVGEGAHGDQGGGKNVGPGGRHGGDLFALGECERGEFFNEPGDLIAGDDGRRLVEWGRMGEEGTGGRHAAAAEDVAGGGTEGGQGAAGFAEEILDAGGDLVLGFGRDGLRGVFDELLGEADAAEGETFFEAELFVFVVEDFERAAAEIEDVEGLEVAECGVGGGTLSDVSGLLVAGENAEGVAGFFADEADEVVAVGGVADGAGGDESGDGRIEGGGLPEEFADGVERGGLRGVGKERCFLRDAGADAGVDEVDGEGLELSVGGAPGEEAFDGVGADVDDEGGFGIFVHHGRH